MNYEELYANVTPMEKEIKDSASTITRLYKKIVKDTESGNIVEIRKSLELLAQAADTLSERTSVLEDQIGEFDQVAYFEDGQFIKEMLEECAKKEIDVIGESPVFEMFPYRVRIDASNQEVYLDRKKLPTMRPLSVAQTISTSREKLMRANFNAQRFADELADAYDVTILKSGKRPGADIYLTTIYKTLVPMGRFRRDYDQNSFAFDVARLYDSEIDETKKGRRWQFGPSRNNSKAIRILDREGNEQFLATVKFFDIQGE